MSAPGDIDLERHARHVLLKEIGAPGQKRLKGARTVIIGAGGLGSPAALYLAAGGVGSLVIVDPDRVSLDNLQRQVLFRTRDVGTPKTDAAKGALNALDPAVQVETADVRADASTLPGLLDGADLVLDGCDDFETRFAVNAACLAAGIPLISGALGPWSAQVSVFARALETDSPCYRCLVPDIPPDAPSCELHGVVGALAGVAGSMMALEAVKLITRAGAPLIGRLWLMDALAGTTRVARLARDPACPACSGYSSAPVMSQ